VRVWSAGAAASGVRRPGRLTDLSFSSPEDRAAALAAAAAAHGGGGPARAVDLDADGGPLRVVVHGESVRGLALLVGERPRGGGDADSSEASEPGGEPLYEFALGRDLARISGDAHAPPSFDDIAFRGATDRSMARDAVARAFAVSRNCDYRSHLVLWLDDDDGGALQALVRVSATTRDPDVVHVGVEVASEEARRRRPRPRSDPGPAQ